MGIPIIDKIVAKNGAFRILLDFIGLGRGSVADKATTVSGDKFLIFDSEDADKPKLVDHDHMPPGGNGAWWYNVENFGAVADVQRISNDNVRIAANNNILQVDTDIFMANDIGKYIQIGGAGVDGKMHNTTISSVISAIEVELTDIAVTTVTNATTGFGSDSAAAIQDCINYVQINNYPGVIYFPPGDYLIGSTLELYKSNIMLYGNGKEYESVTRLPPGSNHYDADPISTQVPSTLIRWIGPAGGTMLHIYSDNSIPSQHQIKSGISVKGLSLWGEELHDTNATVSKAGIGIRMTGGLAQGVIEALGMRYFTTAAIQLECATQLYETVAGVTGDDRGIVGYWFNNLYIRMDEANDGHKVFISKDADRATDSNNYPNIHHNRFSNILGQQNSITPAWYIENSDNNIYYLCSGDIHLPWSSDSTGPNVDNLNTIECVARGEYFEQCGSISTVGSGLHEPYHINVRDIDRGNAIAYPTYVNEWAIVFNTTTTYPTYIISDSHGKIYNQTLDTRHKEYDNGNSGAAKTIDFDVTQCQKVTISEATSLTLNAPHFGIGFLRLRILGGDGFDTAFSNSNILWSNFYNLSELINRANLLLDIFWDGTNFNITPQNRDTFVLSNSTSGDDVAKQVVTTFDPPVASTSSCTALFSNVTKTGSTDMTSGGLNSYLAKLENTGTGYVSNMTGYSVRIKQSEAAATTGSITGLSNYITNEGPVANITGLQLTIQSNGSISGDVAGMFIAPLPIAEGETWAILTSNGLHQFGGDVTVTGDTTITGNFYNSDGLIISSGKNYSASGTFTIADAPSGTTILLGGNSTLPTSPPNGTTYHIVTNGANPILTAGGSNTIQGWDEGQNGTGTSISFNYVTGHTGCTLMYLSILGGWVMESVGRHKQEDHADSIARKELLCAKPSSDTSITPSGALDWQVMSLATEIVRDSGYTISSDTVTIDKAGVYLMFFSVRVKMTSAAATYWANIYDITNSIMVDGTDLPVSPTSIHGVIPCPSVTVNVTTGQQFQIRHANDTGGTYDLKAGGSFFTIKRMR